MERLKRLIRSLSNRIADFRQAAANAHHHVQAKLRERKADNERRRRLDEVIRHLSHRQEAYMHANGERDDELQDSIKARVKERQAIRTRKERLTESIKKFREQAAHRLKRARYWAAKRTVYRKKLKEARRRLDPRFEPWMTNGCPTTVTDDIKEVIARAVVTYDLYATATRNGTHAPGSWHYQGRAVDVAGAYEHMTAFQNFAAKEWPAALEIFGPDSFYIKNGQRYSGAFPDHGDHDHVAR